MVDEKGRVTGVIAEDKNGDTIKAYVKAVIISDGGFGNNVDSLLWDFDDGSTAIAYNIEHQWPAGLGSYDVSLIAFNKKIKSYSYSIIYMNKYLGKKI